jgi:hypothetical protein
VCSVDLLRSGRQALETDTLMGLKRSPAEIRFRLRQEFANLRYLLLPPNLPEGAWSFPVLPEPPIEEIPHFAPDCLRIADEILQHRFPLLGISIETGESIAWRRDYVSGRETGLAYFRRLPYLDAHTAGDHKNIWEINRHQHLVLLAQAYRISGERKYLGEIVDQLESWFEQNPFQRGINWTSALEVAFRALSWIWVDHLVGRAFEAGFRHRLLEGLFQHGLHLEVNLSRYFSPNTHLLGEALALDAIGRLYPQFPRATQWTKTGSGIVGKELDRQVLGDGCYFELSPYYHVYALDMFVFHAALAGADEHYRGKLKRMAEFLDLLTGASGRLPFLGDDDGGRFFHPYGERDRFGLATLATCGLLLDRPEWIRDPQHLEDQAFWWLGTRPVLASVTRPTAASVGFVDCGLFVMAAGDAQVIVDAGPFGPRRAGHSHADTLSIVVRKGEVDILADPGTYTYVGDPVWRDWFRGTAAHNTVRIDGEDQGVTGGPFAWRTRPTVEVLAWESSPERDRLVASCSYRGFRHEREVVFEKGAMTVAVADRVSGSDRKEHRIEQFWHFGPEADKSRLCFGGTISPREIEGWVSPALGRKMAARVWCVEVSDSLPLELRAEIVLG